MCENSIISTYTLAGIQIERPYRSNVGKYFPYVAPFHPRARQQIIEVSKAGLPPAVVVHHRTKGLKMHAKAREQTQQRRFHHSTKMRHAMLGSHFYYAPHKADRHNPERADALTR